MAFYGVRMGRIIGVFTDWKECYKSSVGGFSNAVYRKFSTREQAERWVAGEDTAVIANMAKQVVNKRESTVGTNPVDSKTAVVYTAGGVGKGGETIAYGGVFIYNDIVTRISGCDSYGSVAKMPKILGEMISVMKSVSLCLRNGVHRVVIRYTYEGIESWVRGSWQAKNEFSLLYAKFMNYAAKSMEICFENVTPRSDRLSLEAENLALAAISKNLKCSYAEFLNSCAICMR